MQFKDAESAKKFDRRMRALGRLMRRQNMYIHLRDYMGYVNEMGDLTSRDEAFKVIEELGAANQQDKPKIRLASSKQIGGNHYKRMDIQPWDVVDFGPK